MHPAMLVENPDGPFENEIETDTSPTSNGHDGEDAVYPRKDDRDNGNEGNPHDRSVSGHHE